MNRKKLMLVMAGIMSLSVALTGCGGSSDSGSAGKDNANSAEKVDKSESKIKYEKAASPDKCPDTAKNRKDTIIIGTNPLDGVLNPVITDMATDLEVCKVMFSPLMNYKDDGSVEPVLLSEMPKVSEDGKVYTMKLKDGLKWSDGEPITTDDIEFTYFILADKTYTGKGELGPLGLKGWEDYKEGKTKDISGIKKIDKQTIEFTIDKPIATALADLGVFRPIPKHYYGKKYTQGNANVLDELNRKPEVTSGAYKFVSYKEGQEVVLEANDNFFRGKPKVKNIIYKMTSSKTILAQIESGEVDIAVDTSLTPESMEQFKGMEFVDLNYYPNNGYGYIAFNMLGNSKFKDQKVRQACMYATNRKSIVENVYGEYADLINLPQAKTSWAYPKEEKFEEYKYDLEKAEKLFDEAGWKKNAEGKREKDGEVFKIKFLQSADNEVSASIVGVMKEDFEKIGIEFVPEQLDFNTMGEKRTKARKDNDDKAYDMFFAAWGLDPDPSATTIFKTGGIQNDGGYSNKKVDELLQKGLDEVNQDKRKPIYAEMYKELNKDLPYMFVYQRMYCTALNSRIKNFKDSNFVRFNEHLDDLSLE